ncbi:hypothetical protein TI05_12450 [Achromatium sp. WMS3]|nr:hypothetical protein TI05_12450 [Achromatium sp. WMS3]
MVKNIPSDTPSLWRHLAAIGYDWLLVTALLVLAAALIVIPLGLLGIDVDRIRQHTAFRSYLFLVIPMVFFCGFWMYGGQTLGMRTWKIKVVRFDGMPLRFQDALLRFISAILSVAMLGMGFWWCLVDAQHLTWHDRFSATRLVLDY